MVCLCILCGEYIDYYILILFLQKKLYFNNLEISLIIILVACIY
jgi:hypothetical protein